MSNRITVIVVNYNAGEHLLACLGALRAQTLPHDVIVIDNCSSDGSARAAHDAFPDVSYVPLRRNVGFARAVNLAARRVRERSELVVTLNPDTVPRPDFLEHLTQPFDDHPRLGSTAGTLVFSTDESLIASAGINVHRNGVAIDRLLGEPYRSDVPAPVFGASGGAAAYRLTALEDIRWFPDAFFLYLEDVDTAWRLRLRGWETLWVPNAVATHAYSFSAREASPLKRRLLARNRLWTLARCLPRELWSRDRLHIIGFDTLAVGHAIARRDIASLRGRAEGIAALPLRVLERQTIQARATVDIAELSRWVQPGISPVRLLRLRRLTSSLAEPVRS